MKKDLKSLNLNNDLDLYDGSTIKSRTPLFDAEQTHKYKLGLFISGLVALAAAIITLILITFHVLNGAEADDPIGAGITSTSIIFVIALAVDVIFTVNINRYIKEKRALLIYIPSLVLMVAFSVPQLLSILGLFGIKTSEILEKFGNVTWANYVNIAICSLFVVAETIRIILHRHDLNIYKELKEVLH